MKKLFLSILLISVSFYCLAQQELSFPFQGGNTVMTKFFKDSIAVSPQIIQKRAAGLVVFKFTADIKGNITRLVIYYADDMVLAEPLVAALKKSNHKWIIPDKEKLHDFIIPFSVSFNIPLTGNEALKKAFFEYYITRKPILTLNQVPLDPATLLPTVMVNYDVK